MADFNIEIGLKTVTCHKGHIYAIPYWMLENDCKCPMCSTDEVHELRWAKAKLNNVINGLRGENTKLRKRLK
ncbi:MAG TPA: hypothetical protein ENI07_15585 [Desulfobacterales bacterium]|nr:hypothetical protein [Desulfobacterales bacterium]